MKLLTKVSIIFNRTIDFAAILCGIIVIFLMLSVCMEVVLRYFWGHSTVWVIEIAEYLLIFIPFAVGAWVLKREGHVRMDLILNLLNQRTQSIFSMVTSFVGAIVCFILTYYGAETTWYLFKAGHIMPTGLRVPRFIVIAIIVVGFFLLAIQFLIRAKSYMRSWKALRDGEEGPGKTVSE